MATKNKVIEKQSINIEHMNDEIIQLDDAIDEFRDEYHDDMKIKDTEIENSTKEYRELTKFKNDTTSEDRSSTTSSIKTSYPPWNSAPPSTENATSEIVSPTTDTNQRHETNLSTMLKDGNTRNRCTAKVTPALSKNSYGESEKTNRMRKMNTSIAHV